MTLDEKLDEILSTLVNEVEWCVNPAAGAIELNREKEQAAQKTAKQAIKQLIEEVQTESYKKGYIDKGIEEISK